MRSWIDRRLYVLVVALLILPAMCSIEQVRNLFQLPDLSTVEQHGLVVLFYGYVIALAAFDVALVWFVVPPDAPNRPSRRASTVGFWATCRILTRHLVRWYRRRKSWRSAAVAQGLGAAGIALLVVGVSERFADAPFLDRPVATTFGILLLATGLLALVQPILPRWTRRLFWRTAGALIASCALGEIIWWSVRFSVHLSYRNYSIWAIFEIMLLMLLFARVADAWQARSNYPVRLGMLLAAMPLFLIMHSEQVGVRTPSPPVPIVVAQLDPWLVRLRDRIRAMNEEQPVVFIAASGGGSRASLFTALVLEDLSREPVTFVGRNGKPQQFHVLRQTAFLSGVSGGALASAYFAAHGPAEICKARVGPEGLKNSFREELMSEMRRETERLSSGYVGRIDDPATLNLPSAADDDSEWYLRSRYMDAMCTDFMAPLLRGAIYLGRERGDTVRRFWERELWTDKAHVQSTPEATLADDSPFLICNATEITRGTPLLIGFPAVPAPLFARAANADPATFPEKSLARSLEQFGPATVRVSLAEAVRLSANFPWGFSVARLPIGEAGRESATPRDPRSPAATIDVIDGGVYDNTGIGTLRQIVERIVELAESSPHNEVAAEIVGLLRERGVVIVEIDSGAKQQEPGSLERFFASALEPLAAIENAGYSGAELAKHHHLRTLNQLLPDSDIQDTLRKLTALDERFPTSPSRDDRPATTPLLGGSRKTLEDYDNVVHVVAQCNHDKNVMTAWALGPTDKAQILSRFLFEAQWLRLQIAQQLQVEFVTRVDAVRTARDTIKQLNDSQTMEQEDYSRLSESLDQAMLASNELKRDLVAETRLRREQAQGRRLTASQRQFLESSRRESEQKLKAFHEGVQQMEQTGQKLKTKATSP